MNPETPLDAARDAFERLGIMPLPVPYKSKNPGREGWQHERLTVDRLPERFNGAPLNLGGLWGEPSGGVVDGDLDCEEAKRAAAVLLPETDAVYGHAGNPRSHRLYRCSDGTTPERTSKFQDPARREDRVLIELRSTGTQSLLPGSTHPDGPVYRWERRGPPATVDGGELERAVRRTAAAALLGRYWPKGPRSGRHDAALALSGWLARAGWGEQ
jgi:putative DNA primase/helicase